MSSLNSRRSLDQLHVAKPCHESWEAMSPAGTGGRHCGSCAKTVHELSRLSRADAERLIDAAGASVCVRFERDRDGRVLTREDFERSSLPPRRDGWLRRVVAMAAALGVGSFFNFGCDRTPTTATVGTPAVGSSALPLLPGNPQTMGDVDDSRSTTQPATQSTIQPTTQAWVNSPLMGEMMPFPEPPPPSKTTGKIAAGKAKSVAPKTKAATPKRGRPL